MKVAAIDIGTNSFLCLIAKIKDGEDGPTLDLIEDHARVVRLGEKVNENKSFLPEALMRAEICLRDFKESIDKHKVDKIIATATSAARDVENGDELRKICEELYIPLHIIEGTREAELSFAGAISALPDPGKIKVLVVDVGGGSTELIYREPGKDLKMKSYNLGAVRLTEMFLTKDPVDTEELGKLREYTKNILKDYGTIKPDVIIAVAGTPTTLACVDQKIAFQEEKVEGYVLTRQKIKNLTEILGALPLSFRKKTKGLDAMRADVIVAGSAILELCLDLTDSDDMCVSTRGLRYGVALHHKEFK